MLFFGNEGGQCAHRTINGAKVTHYHPDRLKKIVHLIPQMLHRTLPEPK